jgi:hypothetical protein
MVDLLTMRVTARRLLGPDGGPDTVPPTLHETETLTSTLRGHIELLAPKVEQVAGRLRKDNVSRYCALACVGEARGKLRAAPGPGSSGAVAYARRLARVLNALCTHYEELPQHGSSHAQ